MLTFLVWAAMTEYHNLGALNNRILFLPVPEAGGLRSGYKHSRAPGEGPLPGCRWLCAHCVLPWWRAERAGLWLTPVLTRVQILLVRALPLWLTCLLRAPPLILSQWGFRPLHVTVPIYGMYHVQTLCSVLGIVVNRHGCCPQEACYPWGGLFIK